MADLDDQGKKITEPSAPDAKPAGSEGDPRSALLHSKAVDNGWLYKMNQPDMVAPTSKLPLDIMRAASQVKGGAEMSTPQRYEKALEGLGFDKRFIDRFVKDLGDPPAGDDGAAWLAVNRAISGVSASPDVVEQAKNNVDYYRRLHGVYGEELAGGKVSPARPTLLPNELRDSRPPALGSPHLLVQGEGAAGRPEPYFQSNPKDPARNYTFTEDGFNAKAEMMEAEGLRIEAQQQAEAERKRRADEAPKAAPKTAEAAAPKAEKDTGYAALAASLPPPSEPPPVTASDFAEKKVAAAPSPPPKVQELAKASAPPARREQTQSATPPAKSKSAPAAPLEAAPASAVSIEPSGTPVERALAMLAQLEKGADPKKLLAAMLREAALYINLLAPKGRKFTGAAMQAQIDELSAERLVSIAELGSGRAAAYHLMAQSPATLNDGQRIQDMPVAEAVRHVYAKDARGLPDVRMQGLRDALERTTARTGHGERWLMNMVQNTDSVIAPRMKERGLVVNNGMTAKEIFAAFDRITPVAAPQIALQEKTPDIVKPQQGRVPTQQV